MISISAGFDHTLKMDINFFSLIYLTQIFSYTVKLYASSNLYNYNKILKKLEILKKKGIFII